VLYVTERAVFRLTKEGLRLVEVPEGVDVQRDVLDRMSFEVAVEPRLLARRATVDACTSYPSEEGHAGLA
jgi:acyl CoA:acetate/3-ketoacid CoA transferase